MKLNLPGHLSYDSVVQLFEGRIGLYHGWHPAVMSWLLGVADGVWRGTSLFVLLNAFVLFGAMLSLVWIVPKVSWAAVAVALGCVLLPQFLLYQGIVWKDVLFANAAVAGLVALAHAAARWRMPRLRITLLLVSWAFMILAALARQNGAVLLPFVAIALAWLAHRHGVNGWRAATNAAVTLLLALGTLAVSLLAFAPGTVGVSSTSRQVRLLEFYDLNGALAADPTLAMPELQRTHPVLLRSMRREGRRLYTPQRSDVLAAWVPRTELAKAPMDILHVGWMQFIVHHPGLYLRNRAEVFRWLALTPDIQACVPYVIGVDGPPVAMRALRLQSRYSDNDEWMDHYAGRLVGTPAFSHIPFMLLGCAVLAFLVVRRRDADIAIACMLGGVAIFTVSFLFIAIACDYRYLYLVDLSALISTFYVALDPTTSDAAAQRS